ncbi:Gfo/Idh/MocA family oxidoreductase [bacterium]|nr:Gfo/Idh/MocA family oxidoreductase [bacterium]
MTANFEPVRLCLVGVSNFAESHAGSVRKMEEEGLAKQTCALVRSPQKYADAVAKYQERGVKVYFTLEEMLREEQGKTELITLPIAIPDHAAVSIACMEAGYNVLCEKPPAATIEQIDAMIEAQKRTGKMCAIGFQNQSKNTVRALKRAICDGRLGDIQHIETMATWVRLETYYERNDWAGKLLFFGKYCLDGSAQNALAHYLYNGLYWASPKWLHAASPVKVRGEVYHAHPITSEDLSGIQVETDTGVLVTYLVTLAGWEHSGPISKVYGTKGWAEWAMSGSTVFHFDDGTTETVEFDGNAEHHEVFRNAIRYLRGVDAELNCPVEMTRPHTVALNAAFESNGAPQQIPAEYVTREPRNDTIFTAINDIPEVIRQGYEQGKLYSDLGVPWARATRWVDTRDYRAFRPSF